jgi:hypothetical protein
MARKIMVITGSPRKTGNTNTVVTWFVDAARKAGAEVEVVDAIYCDGGRGRCGPRKTVRWLFAKPLLSFLLLFGVAGMSGCWPTRPAESVSAFDVSGAVLENEAETMTIEERKLLDYVIYSRDETSEGSVAQSWAEHVAASAKEGHQVLSTTIVTLFMFLYPETEFPHGRDIGLIYSDTDRQRRQCTRNNATFEARTKTYPSYFSIWRIPSEESKNIRAHVRIIVWITDVIDKQEKHKYLEMYEEFEWKDGKWRLVNSDGDVLKSLSR